MTKNLKRNSKIELLIGLIILILLILSLPLLKHLEIRSAKNIAANGQVINAQIINKFVDNAINHKFQDKCRLRVSFQDQEEQIITKDLDTIPNIDCINFKLNKDAIIPIYYLEEKEKAYIKIVIDKIIGQS